MREAPKWVSLVLVPFIQLVLAFLVAGLVIWLIGENPWEAGKTIWIGAFGSTYGWGSTLFYATSLIFTGLATAVAFHAGLFNIGGEGQAYIGGLGIALVCLWLDPFMPALILVPVTLLSAAIFGALWALIPAYLQAVRGSHIVITTIMFNFIAASLMQWLLSGALKPASRMEPSTRIFETNTWLPLFKDMTGWFGYKVPKTELNFSFIVALLACLFVYILIWRTRWGYEIRTIGANTTAAIYGGIKPARITIVVMLISGGLAGLMATNVIMGNLHKVETDFVNGVGFTGIAVALVGRNHPLGIILAALLFGGMTAGSFDLQFFMQRMTPEIIIFFQGLVVLFAGALEYMVRPGVEKAYWRFLDKFNRGSKVTGDLQSKGAN